MYHIAVLHMVRFAKLFFCESRNTGDRNMRNRHLGGVLPSTSEAEHGDLSGKRHSCRFVLPKEEARAERLDALACAHVHLVPGHEDRAQEVVP